MFVIFLKEVNIFLSSLIAYLVIGCFLGMSGLVLWVFPDTNVLEYGFAEMDVFFKYAPYLFLLLVPSITMRSFSEEKKNGTLDILLTSPVSEEAIIGAKYLSGVFLILLALAPSIIFYASLSFLAYPTGNIDTGAIIGSYIGLLLLGSVFASIGIFCSSCTESQIVAFIITCLLCFFFYEGFESLSRIDVWKNYSLWMEKLGIVSHYHFISKGIIDIADILYFMSIIFLFLLATKISLSFQK
ncbi:MAG: gliding motility-associated ABC transporter permease subunit GldF [Chitinophagaceae bacterium]|nr:gliding motility-associated ABC transporter permease subunit GldF [Chitinophagaceae bacterium]